MNQNPLLSPIYQVHMMLKKFEDKKEMDRDLSVYLQVLKNIVPMIAREKKY